MAVPAGALASLTPMMPSGVLLIYDPVAKTCSYAFAAPPSTRPGPPGSPGDVGWVDTRTRAARAFALRLADTLDRLGPATRRATPAFRKLPSAARRIPVGALRTGVRQLARGLPPALARPLRRSGSTPAELAGLRRAAGVATAAGAATTGPSTMAAACADPDAQRLLARSALAMRCYRVVDKVLADATL